MHEVRGQLEQERRRSDGGGDLAVGRQGDAVLLREGQQRLGGLLGHEGQVDGFACEGLPVGPAEQQQRLGEVDRAGVDGLKAVQDLAGVVRGVGAGHVQQRLGDRQRGAQLVRRVGREPPLLGHVRLEPGQHRVEGVGELAELVLAARQPHAVRERSRGRRAGGVRDARQGASMRPARTHPPRRPNTRRHAITTAAKGAKPRTKLVPGVTRHAPCSLVWNHPSRRRNTPTAASTREPASRRKPGVAEGELETDAQPGRPIHGPLPPARSRWARCRCGTRRPARSR